MEDRKHPEKLIETVVNEIKKAIIGKDEVVLKMILSIISGGHILIEDVPGVGKTTLATALCSALSLSFKRIQFTPDVMASDVTGYNVYNRKKCEFEFIEGAVFANIVLADELNRTSGKTQSALLEAMEEEAVTIDGITRPLPHPFTVIAAQNPSGTVGTAFLPESQLDRFMVCLTLGYPEKSDEISILKRKPNVKTSVRQVLSIDDLNFLRQAASQIYVDDKIYDYIAEIAKKTRESDILSLGLSPRGSLALASMARATALAKGRSFVLPEDVLYIWEDVVRHRVVLSPKAERKFSGRVSGAIAEIVMSVPVPAL
ncbi:MAG: MoxR family ATPase [Ruminococcus sp.]|jgi:MoxR-like ATPase|nr:MoxR family ATPase [Ruminococcus sp.]